MEERQHQVESAARQANDANAHGPEKADTAPATEAPKMIGRRKGDLPPAPAAPTQNRRASDKPNTAPSELPAGRHEAAAAVPEKAPAPAPEKGKPEPEAKKPVEVKVEAPAPVAVHITPPSDTRQPTMVHLPSAHPETPSVTVSVQPRALVQDAAERAVPAHPAVAALHGKVDDLSDKVDAVARAAVPALVKAAATPPKAGLSTLEKLLLCAIGLIGVLEVVQHWGEIAKHFAQ